MNVACIVPRGASAQAASRSPARKAAASMVSPQGRTPGPRPSKKQRTRAWQPPAQKSDDPAARATSPSSSSACPRSGTGTRPRAAPGSSAPRNVSVEPSAVRRVSKTKTRAKSGTQPSARFAKAARTCSTCIWTRTEKWRWASKSSARQSFFVASASFRCLAPAWFGSASSCQGIGTCTQPGARGASASSARSMGCASTRPWSLRHAAKTRASYGDGARGGGVAAARTSRMGVLSSSASDSGDASAQMARMAAARPRIAQLAHAGLQ